MWPLSLLYPNVEMRGFHHDGQRRIHDSAVIGKETPEKLAWHMQTLLHHDIDKGNAHFIWLLTATHTLIQMLHFKSDRVLWPKVHLKILVESKLIADKPTAIHWIYNH